MAKGPKAKRGKHYTHVVMYIRVRPEEYAHITKLAKRRGYPATISSVAAEIISRGLAAEAASKEAPRG